MMQRSQLRKTAVRFPGLFRRDGRSPRFADNEDERRGLMRERKLITSCASHNLLLNLAFSDSTFHIQDKDSTGILETIPVHKMLLSAGSEMFERMFLSEMSECHTGIVTITDFCPAVVKEMLRFIYTGQCQGQVLTEHPDSMIMIAHKYVVKQMADYLENFYALNLSKQIPLSTIWSISRTWSMRKLEKAVLKYIQENPRRHLNDREFRRSLDTNSLQKILSSIVGLSHNFVSDDDDGEENEEADRTEKLSLICKLLRRRSEVSAAAQLAAYETATDHVTPEESIGFAQLATLNDY